MKWFGVISGHLLSESGAYAYEVMQSVYPTTQFDWAEDYPFMQASASLREFIKKY